MKTKHNFKRTLFALLILFVFSSSSVLTAQKSNNSNHLIIIAKMNNGILDLTCTSGCNWSNISLPLNKTSVINDNGEVTSENRSSESNFQFSIAKTNTGIKLSAIKGVSWTTLDVKLSEGYRQTITEGGLAH